MAEIRWRQSDYVKLGRAVADFNRTVKKLEKENAELLLPELASYKDLKEKIQSRQGFNEAINDLKALNKESSQKVVTIESGEEVLKWYYDKVNRNAQRRERELINQLAGLNLAENKASKPYRTDEEKQARAELRNLRSIWKKQRVTTGGDIKKITRGERKSRTKSMLENNDKDSEIRKEKLFFNNYKKTMQRYQNMQNYQKLEKYLEKTNSHDFWLKVKDDEMLRDLTYESDNTRGQDSFNRFLEHLGVELETNKIEPVNLQEAQIEEMNEEVL